MRISVHELTQRLTQLAEALQGRAPGAQGMLVWMDALAECQQAEVLSALTDWPKNSNKMPTPADILKAARELASGRRERDAQAQNAVPGFSVERMKADSAIARRELAKIRTIFASPKPGAKDWARRIVDGEFTPTADTGYARVLAAKVRQPQARAETAADVEARLEREAMQQERA